MTLKWNSRKDLTHFTVIKTLYYRGRFMGTLILAALGFDEKFIVRCIMRNNPSEIARVILFQPLSRDNYSERRSQQAWNNVRKVVEEYMGIEVEKHQIDPALMMNVIREARKLIIDWAGKRVIICGGSGMRALAIALVTATFTLPPEDKNKVIIDIDLESSDNYVRIRPGDIDKLRLTPRDEKVLEAVAKLGKASVADISRVTGLSKPTVSRTAKRLAEWGYLERVGKGVYRARG